MRRTSLPRLLLTIFLFGGIAVSAASAAVQNRIATAVSGSSRVAIPNSVHGKVRFAADLGPAPADTRLEAMTLRFSMTDAQQAALDQLLADQQDPSSALYRQWLTPAQYAAQFGLSAADIAKVTAWLTSQGFTISEVANSGTFVRFSGTVAQAQTAFATSIHSLSLNGETHFANVTDAAVPSGLASVVAGVTGLHNFKLKSRVRNMEHTQFTSSNTGNHFIVPGDFYGIYNETPLLTAGTTGAGVKIAVMGQTDISMTDIAAFRTAAGLTANAPTVQLYGCDPGVYNALTAANQACDNGFPPTIDDLQESSLDVEWSGATAPGASIIFVNSWDVIGISLTDAIDNNLAPIMSVSYGSCEPAWGTNEMNTLNQLFKQANAQGITIIGPGGDDGATDCDAGPSATTGLTVDFPASSPYVTGLGGTQFNEGTATGSTTYWSGTNTTINAGSAGAAVTASVLPNTYIPEAVWDEDIAASEFSAGGGGVSGYFSKPAWQKGTGVPADASRDVPDLSLNSAPSHDGYIYCVAGSCASGFQGALAANVGTVAGGTSFAAPSFAGILALVEQKVGPGLGNINPEIYAMANNAALYNSTSTSAFHDVTTGNNNNPCTTGTPNCPNGGTIGFSAGVGYDLATGWGSVNVNNFVGAWGTVTPFGIGTLGPDISSTVVGASPTSVAAGGTTTLTANLTGLIPTLSNGVLTTIPGATPTGTVQFLVNNVAVGSPVTLVSGVATLPLVTSCSGLGQQVISASYSGDATYAGSKGSGISTAGFTTQFSTVTPVEVQVTSGTCPDFSISAPVPPTVTSGSPSVVITVAPINNFTGTVTFSASAIESSNVAPTFSFSPSSVAITSSSATTTLTLNNITAALHAPAMPDSSHRAPWYAAAGSGVTIASLLCLILPRRRRLGGLLLVALSIALIGGTTGCGNSNGTVSASTKPDAGTYVVTVTATYTNSSNVQTSHVTSVTFTVQ
jgi:subtilase family serine protease